MHKKNRLTINIEKFQLQVVAVSSSRFVHIMNDQILYSVFQLTSYAQQRTQLDHVGVIF